MAIYVCPYRPEAEFEAAITSPGFVALHSEIDKCIA